ncbi:MAG: cupin domain-containing protein [Gammaproteobacteria bacterium]|nr:cupin domain-containing protein [Gammaproteobacteria bacterium]
MNHANHRAKFVGAFATALAIACTAVSAQDGPSPIRMNVDRMAGLGLTPVSNSGFIDILVDGTLEFEAASLFTGEELRAVIFASTPATTDHRNRPLEYDEFVLVLNGKLILTEQNGNRQEFLPGDTVILPKGYTGTWQMQGDYRELAVVPSAPSEITATGGSPVRLDPDMMAGLNLTPIPNDGFIDILVEGELEFTIGSVFAGEDLRAVVVESTPAKTDHRDRPLEYDEFVLVLNGGLVLTEQNGRRQEFRPGDALIVPKGYTGTWEQLGTYRELALILAQN